nr:hypothetical protein [Tanacetum cinerariifolium]
DGCLDLKLIEIQTSFQLSPLVQLWHWSLTNSLDTRNHIQELCEEYYEDIMPIVMEKALKDVHARLDFEESP